MYLDFSFWTSSNAATRDFSSWSDSSSLILRTASWPSLAERASVRSSTCDRSSLNILLLWDCSEFHLSARRRVWFSSARVHRNYFIIREKEREEGREMAVMTLAVMSHLLPSCKSFALWMTEAISWLREDTSLRSSWFSRRRLDRIWLCGSSEGGEGEEEGGGRGTSCLLDSCGTAKPESELSGVSVAGRWNKREDTKYLSDNILKW